MSSPLFLPGASNTTTSCEATPFLPGIFRVSWNLQGVAALLPSIFLREPRVDAAPAETNPARETTPPPDGPFSDPAGKLVRGPEASTWGLQDPSGSPLLFLRPASARHLPRAPRLSIAAFVETPSPRFYGSGNAVSDLAHTESHAHVGNGIAATPFFWSSGGWALLGVSDDDNEPARWDYDPMLRVVTWTFPSGRGDLYIMPAATLKLALQSFARLTGFAPVPPRWTFGYLQSRWGWKNRADIEATIREFRGRQLPVDAFILDFEWYTAANDYKTAPAGINNFPDFAYNKALFPEPKAQLESYRRDGIRIAAIRKPRLADRQTLLDARRQGWLLRRHGDGSSYLARNINFELPAVREWYAEKIARFLEDGIAGWWNDEGEASYSTYHYWILAEKIAADRVRPGERHWTINRAFSPGLQRLGAAAWTGDIDSYWSDLQDTPPSLLNWSLSGMPYSACDIGGFKRDNTPELFTRWMQAGVFFPQMRAHSTVEIKPRFPWLYGTEAENAIRQALELRYRLLPYIYSLAHEAYSTGLPLMRPMLMEFPDDVRFLETTDQWMLGEGLLAAPILSRGGKRTVELPHGLWYPFETTPPLQGNCLHAITATLQQIPLYIKAGTILPLGPVIQSTEFGPGGTLELQIYAGANGDFRLVEDDGITEQYQTGQLCETHLRWDDAQRRLTWRRQGSYTGGYLYNAARVRLFMANRQEEADLAWGNPGEWRSAS